MKIVLAQLNPTIGAIRENQKKIIREIERAREEHADLIVFPELAITGYFPDDLLLQPDFIEKAKEALHAIIKASQAIGVIVGLPRFSENENDKSLLNSAAVIENGELLGFQDKSLLPTYDVFDERRYFHPAEEQKLWIVANRRVAVLICEDIWPFGDVPEQECYPFDPLQFFQKNRPDLFVNISASPYALGKIERRNKVARTLVEKLSCPVVLCNQVGGQDGLLFDGSSVAYNRDGKLLCQAISFAESHTVLTLEKEATSSASPDESQELYLALTMGLRDYFVKQGFKKAIVGLSGGIDSALVACIAVQALGQKNVKGVLLPSRFTSPESTEDAYLLAKNLGIDTTEISIEGPFQAYLDSLQQHEPFGVTEENIQARVRGTLLMAISNSEGALLLNTSNKSELAMGYSTLYGDACGAVAVIGDLLKSQVYELADWIRHHGEFIPLRVIQKEPSAELRHNQKDSDSLPEYIVLDPIIEACVVKMKSASTIASELHLEVKFVEEIVRKMYAAEYKRRQCPFQLRVSEKAFSAGRRVPIVQRWC